MIVKRRFKTIKRIIEDLEKGIDDCPFDISLIPNNMGINLVSVLGIEWNELENSELLDLKIIFKPVDYEKE